MNLAGIWMTEKSFAATPYSCRDVILDVHIIMQPSIENFSMASDKIMSRSKDFKGIHVPVYRDQLHLSGESRYRNSCPKMRLIRPAAVDSDLQ